MCLRLVENTEVLIAEADIVCYKLLKMIDDEYRTMFFNARVSIGCTYESKLKIAGSIYPFIYEGLHSYIDLNDAVADAKYNCIDWLCADITVIEVTIPKGSRYYKGWFSDSESFASDKLTYNKIIEVIEYEKEINSND